MSNGIKIYKKKILTLRTLITKFAEKKNDKTFDYFSKDLKFHVNRLLIRMKCRLICLEKYQTYLYYILLIIKV